ncbi:hypothetical protein O181_015218 [Austropuccinia psidii MF-1]|uniref:Chromo domain-containing protein n=1 Tax=Austropuccinia psidii MF-1 TaxID=1389203 RepID=A0A9Q3C222_9BASI|nr:hypothetical protein [Austropuccinia psidii MF-1]
MRDSFVGPFTIITFIVKNLVEVRLTEIFARKPPVFPMSLVKSYHQKVEDMLPSRDTSCTPKDLVKVKDSPGSVKKIMEVRKIILNGKDHRGYLVRFMNQTADKDKWLAENPITDGDLHLIGFIVTRRYEQSHQ